MRTKVLMTGGTGFIGSQLATALAKENDVCLLVREDTFCDNTPEGIEIVAGDLLEGVNLGAIMEEKKPDIVFHLAALTPVRNSFGNPLTYAHMNYIGTVNMVEAAVKCGTVRQFVYASSAEVYGPYAESRTVNEESVPTPTSPYSISKLAGEHYVRYAKERGMGCTVLRPTNTYGRTKGLPEEARHYFVEKLIIAMLKGNDFRMDGSEESERRFMHFSDHLSAYLKVFDNRSALNQVFNVAGKEPAVSLAEVADILREMTGFRKNIGWSANPRPIEPNFLDINASKIEGLGWSAKVSLSEGLRRTVDYWKQVLLTA